MGGGTATGGRIIVVDFEKASEREEKVTHTSTGIYVTLTLEHNNRVRAEANSFTPIKYRTTKGNVGQLRSFVNYNEVDGSDYQDYQSFIQMLKEENGNGPVFGLAPDELLMQCLRTSRRLRNIETAVREH